MYIMEIYKFKFMGIKECHILLFKQQILFYIKAILFFSVQIIFLLHRTTHFNVPLYKENLSQKTFF